jgi:predicted PurR-regulated permease PerM
MQSHFESAREPRRNGGGTAAPVVPLEAPAAASAPAPVPASPAGARARTLRTLAVPLWILAIGTLFGLLRIGREALVPLALAVLIALVLSGVVESLRRLHVPRGISALLLLGIAVVAVAGAVDLVSTPARQWMLSAPRVLHTIERRIRPAQALLQRIDALARRASALASPDANPLAAAAPAPGGASLSAVDVLTGTGWAAGAMVAVLALTLLLLAAGPPTLARMTAALAGDRHAVRALSIIDAIRLEVGRYYATLALINLGFGAVVAACMWLLGMPNPILWGVLAGVLNFIPYLGSVSTLVILTVVALVSFESIARVAGVAATYLGLAALEGHIIEPIFLGRRLDLNPIVVLVAVWIGGWLWGIPGVVVALPALVATKVAATHSRHGEMLVRFLSPGGAAEGGGDTRSGTPPVRC